MVFIVLMVLFFTKDGIGWYLMVLDGEPFITCV